MKGTNFSREQEWREEKKEGRNGGRGRAFHSKRCSEFYGCTCVLAMVRWIVWIWYSIIVHRKMAFLTNQGGQCDLHLHVLLLLLHSSMAYFKSILGAFFREREREEVVAGMVVFLAPQQS